MRHLIGQFLVLLVAAAAPWVPAYGAPLTPYHLDTPGQLEAERRAIRIFHRPEIQSARAKIAQMFVAEQEATTESGRQTLDSAVEEHAFAGLFFSVNNDPSRPAVLWAENAPHAWHGLSVPGSRFGQDNPDNIYRIIFIDNAHEYVLHGEPQGGVPAQVSFELLDSAPGTMNNMGHQIAILQSTNMKFDPDGGFTITIGPKAASGNHFQTVPEARAIWIRDTLSDWNAQAPYRLTISVTGGPKTSPASDEQLARRAASDMTSFARYWLDFYPRYLANAWEGAVNIPPQPTARPGDASKGGGARWGYTSGATVDLKRDEAIVFTVDDMSAKFLGCVFANPWWITTDYAHRSGSVNNGQARRNADGTTTYVIAAEDPGVANWIDTSGLSRGEILLRWQGLQGALPPSNTMTTEGFLVRNEQAVSLKTVRDGRVVPLSQVRTLYPALTESPSQRAKALATRLAGYERRLR
ncbi:MAG: DUF1214 domain-containing protein [Caulobacteraceae bacterium]|nr:DUF1214 domain-containing protein [Caulobacteraceae bacterium]